MKCRSAFLACAALVFAAPLSGQSVAATGVVVSAADIASAITPSDTAPVIDRTLRLVPVGGEYNVSVSVVRRRRVGGATPADALSHAEITEVYHILEGEAVMVSGGVLVDARALDPAGAIVRTLIGPSDRGVAIRGGVTRTVGPGDVVVIPPGTAHGFVELRSAEVRYTVLRVDPHRVLQAR